MGLTMEILSPMTYVGRQGERRTTPEEPMIAITKKIYLPLWKSRCHTWSP